MDKNNLIKLVFVFFVAFASGVISFYFFQKEEPSFLKHQTKEEIFLDGADILPQDVILTKKYIGYVTPIHEALIQPFISGFIEKIEVKGGDNVQKGDTLLVLKQDEYQAAMAAAKASVAQAHANLKNKKIYYERIQKAGKAISPTELDAAEADYLASLAELESAQADFEISKVNYEYTYIKSGIDGVVGDVKLTIGNYVSPQVKLFSVMQFDPIRVVFSVPSEEYHQELQKNKSFHDEKILLQFSNGQIFDYEGVFQYTNNAIDQATDSMAVYADFKNDNKRLIPNSYVTVLCQKKIENAVLVPKKNIVMEDKGNFVYVVRGGVLKKIGINILGSLEENFVLENIFEKGDQIVLQSVNPSELNKKITVQKEA